VSLKSKSFYLGANGFITQPLNYLALRSRGWIWSNPSILLAKLLTDPSEHTILISSLGSVRLTMNRSTAIPDMTVHSRERLLEIWSTPRKAVRFSRLFNRPFTSQPISWVPERSHGGFQRRQTADEKDLQRTFSFLTVRTHFQQMAGW